MLRSYILSKENEAQHTATRREYIKKATSWHWCCVHMMAIRSFLYSVTIYYYYGLFQRLLSSLCHGSIIMFDILIVLLKRSEVTSWINVNHLEHKSTTTDNFLFFFCHRIGSISTFLQSLGRPLSEIDLIFYLYTLWSFFLLIATNSIGNSSSSSSSNHIRSGDSQLLFGNCSVSIIR